MINISKNHKLQDGERGRALTFTGFNNKL